MEAHSKTRSFSELFSFLRGDEGYFPLFKLMASNISDASRALVEMLADNSGDYAAHVERIGSIEHACDDLTHTIILTRMSSQLKVVMSALERPTGITLHLIELHRLENEGDELYSVNQHLGVKHVANTTFSARILGLQKIPPTLVMNLASENYCKPA
jgi:hypothetical protein